MSKDAINDLRNACAAHGLDFRTGDALIKRLEEIVSAEQSAFMSAAKKLWVETEEVSDDRDVELAREALEPFL